MNEPQPPQPPAVSRNLHATLEKALAMYKHMLSESPCPRFSVQWIFGVSQFCDCIPQDILSQTIPILANCLASSSDSVTDATPATRALQIASVHCLSRIALFQGGSLAPQIAHSGAIAEIVKLLMTCESADNGELFVRTLLKCLWISVSNSDECRLVLINENGLELILHMLRSPPDDNRGLVYLFEILSAMAMVDSVRDEIYPGHGLEYLVFSACAGTIASRERACHALGLLAVSPEMRDVIAETRAMKYLVNLFNRGDSRTKLIAANSLGVILSCVDSIRAAAESGAIPVFVELLEGSSEVGRDIAEDAFSMLSIAESNAISIADQMVRILKDGKEEYAKNSAARVLWDIVVYRHDAPILINSGVFPVLLKIVGDDEIGDYLKEKVMSVIGLSSCLKKNRAALVDAGAIPVIGEMLRNEDSNQLRRYALMLLKNFFMDNDYFGMVIDEVGLDVIWSESDDAQSDSMDVDDSDDD